MVLLCYEAQLEARSVHLEVVLILTEDRCTVYVKYSIGSEIILYTPDGIPT
jgi:hypothetical protein